MKGTALLRELFYRGHYAEVVAASCDGGAVLPDDLPAVVGALVHLGRLDEAQSWLRAKGAALAPAARSEARLYVASGLCRQFEHAAARALLMDNVRDWRRSRDDRSRFFALHGLGFYRYMYGRFGAALVAASAAFDAAVSCDFPYGRILAADLKGHTLAQLGRPRAAARQLAVARKQAEALGRAAIVEAIDYALVGYSAMYGLDPAGDVAAIERELAVMALEDTYRRSMLLLELARQHLLRGAARRARRCLDEASRLVFSYQNKRHEVLVNLGYVCLLQLAGDEAQASSLVRTLSRLVDPEVDLTLELRLVGLEHELCLALDLPAAAAKAKLTRLTRRSGRLVSARMLERQERPGPTAPQGEDPLGDLIDRAAAAQPGAVAEVLASGYLGFLGLAAGLGRTRRALVVDLEPASLTVFDRGDVVHLTGAATNLTQRILAQLARGDGSKAALAKALWGISAYHPLKHDQKIYGVVAKLRQALGERGEWIAIAEGGYELAAGVEVRFAGAPKSVREAASEPLPELRDDLSLRQARILDRAKSAPLDARTCAELFSVSIVTASRDLSDLEKKGLLQRLGKGRATTYTFKSGGS